MNYPIDKNYYTDRRDKLLADYAEDARRWSPLVFGRYGEIQGFRILQEARQNFENLIPQIPYIGGDENIYTKNLVDSVRYLALYQAMKKFGKSVEEAGKIIYDVCLVKAGEPRPPIPPGEFLTPEQLWERSKKAAARTQEKRYPGDYVYTFVPGDGKKFDSGLDFTECASMKFYHEQDADELLPYYCYLDFAAAQARGTGFTRTMSLGEGQGKCNHRFKVKGKTEAPWPPPFLKKDRRKRTKKNNVAAIAAFAEYLTSTCYEDLPEAAVASAKQEVLDSLATALGGSGKAGVAELVEVAQEWGGAAQSTVIAHGFKCPAPNAAQVNGTMIHALDYDDGHQMALVHIGCVAVSTAFAAAERMGRISGKELITAIALGGDFTARLGLASKPGKSALASGWHPTTLFGYLGAAAVAGRLFRLDEDRMINALGLAYHQCGGAGSGVADGALAKRMGPGLAAKAGITSALMAERGITGERDPLEGKSGLYITYMGGDYDPSILTADLGKRWEGINIGDKPYPCCGLTHAAIDAVLAIKAKHDFKIEQIKEVTVTAGQAAYDLSRPPEVKKNPRTIIDAQFSVPYVTAAALFNGKVTVDNFTEEAIKRPEILGMAQKINTVLDSAMDRHGVGPSRVTVDMADGASYTEYVEHCLGSTERPMSFQDVVRKFRECAACAVKPVGEDKVEKVIQMVSIMETLPDATEIIRVLG
ncbi:MAG: MmgE/PrpD family protein [Dehalococcoidales bacterium]|jgi:2-methylcitrate dehydratase PrpD